MTLIYLACLILGLILLWGCGQKFLRSARMIWIWYCMALVLAICYYLVVFIVSLTG